MVKKLVQNQKNSHEFFLYGSVDFNGIQTLFEKSESSKAGALSPGSGERKAAWFSVSRKPGCVAPKD